MTQKLQCRPEGNSVVYRREIKYVCVHDLNLLAKDISAHVCTLLRW